MSFAFENTERIYVREVEDSLSLIETRRGRNLRDVRCFLLFRAGTNLCPKH